MTPLFPAIADPSDARAISFPERELTYAELCAAAGAVARAVAGRRRVAVIAEPRAETCVAVVGSLMAGVPIVPINPRSGEAELAHIAADAEPNLLLAGPGTNVPRALGARGAVTVELDGEAEPPASDPAPDDPALIVYTSGTTGPPKGAVIPRRAIASNLDALADAWAWTEHDAVAHALPLFHVHGLVIGLLGPLRRGGRAIHIGRFDADLVRTAFEHGGATMLFGVPTMYRRLAEAAEQTPGLAAALGRARVLVSGS